MYYASQDFRVFNNEDCGCDISALTAVGIEFVYLSVFICCYESRISMDVSISLRFILSTCSVVCTTWLWRRLKPLLDLKWSNTSRDICTVYLLTVYLATCILLIVENVCFLSLIFNVKIVCVVCWPANILVAPPRDSRPLDLNCTSGAMSVAVIAT